MVEHVTFLLLILENVGETHFQLQFFFDDRDQNVNGDRFGECEGEHDAGEIARENSQARAGHIFLEPLAASGWKAADLNSRPKSNPAKLALAARLRRETTLMVKQIAERLSVGTTKSATAALHRWMRNHPQPITTNSSTQPRSECAPSKGAELKTAQGKSKIICRVASPASSVRANDLMRRLNLLRWHLSILAAFSQGIVAASNATAVTNSNDLHFLLEPPPELKRLTLPPTVGESLPAIAQDGAVYIATAGSLYSLTPDLETNWTLPGLLFHGDPAVAGSGNIYLPTEAGNLYCITPGGRILWRFESGDPFFPSPAPGLWTRAISITEDETVYFAGGSAATGRSTVYVVKDGVLIRKLQTADRLPEQVPIIGPDGALYFPTSSGFAAHRPFGNILWSAARPLPGAIDAQGNLYSLSGSKLVSLSASGALRWETLLPDRPTNVLLGEAGRVFAQTTNTLIALNTNGAVLWSNTSEGSFLPTADGGAIIMSVMNAPATSPFGAGFSNWVALREIAPDGSNRPASLYDMGFSRPFSHTFMRSVAMSHSGRFYFRMLGNVNRGGNGALLRWNAPHGLAQSAWPLPRGLRNNNRAIPPQAAPRALLTKTPNGWLLGKTQTTGRASIEISTDLRTWTPAGPLLDETPFILDVSADSAQRRFYRLVLAE